MACRTLETKAGTAVLCSGEWVFGPVFDSVHDAEHFLFWLSQHPDPIASLDCSGGAPFRNDGSDPRDYEDHDLARLIAKWMEVRC
jgi:hypothetical protein